MECRIVIRQTIEDYYKVIDAPNGDRWLIITSVVSDPVYLQSRTGLPAPILNMKRMVIIGIRLIVAKLILNLLKFCGIREN